MQIEIWSDIVCPFCFIGKRNFEAALALLPEADREKVEVTWRSFELDPNANAQPGVSIYELLASKYGRSLEWAKQMNENMTKQGAGVGIKFDFDRVVPTNSFNAHRLLHFARANRKQNETAELLFKAYFSEGKDINDLGVLSEVASMVGLNSTEVEVVLSGDAYKKDVRDDEELAAQFGLSGVPAFVIERKFLISGAQPVEAFLEALNDKSL